MVTLLNILHHLPTKSFKDAADLCSVTDFGLVQSCENVEQINRHLVSTLMLSLQANLFSGDVICIALCIHTCMHLEFHCYDSHTRT